MVNLFLQTRRTRDEDPVEVIVGVTSEGNKEIDCGEKLAYGSPAKNGGSPQKERILP
jgi:hypothetical protein